MIEKKYKEMLNIDETYFINEMKAKEDLKIILMCYSYHWPYIEKKQIVYKNSKIQLCGFSLEKYFDDVLIDNCDSILFYAKNYDENEFTNIKKFAHMVSKEKEKIVTAGYSYPSNDKKYNVILTKISGKLESEKIITGIDYLSQTELVEYALLSHLNVDHINYKKKIKYK